MHDIEKKYQRRRLRRLKKLGENSLFDPFLDLMITSSGGSDNLHEVVHYLDHAGTSYGYLLDQIFAVCARGWGQLIHFAKEREASIPYPLYRILIETDSGHLDILSGRIEDSLIYARRIASAATCYDLLCGLAEAMQGSKSQMDIDVSAMAGLGLLERLSMLDLSFPKSFEELEDLPVWKGPEQLVPIAAIDMDNIEYSSPLGSRALFESRAMIIESALKEENNTTFFTQAFELSKQEYIAGMILVGDKFSGSDYEHLGFSTYLALSDLALMTPAAPAFADLRKYREWEDIHPGYRYQKLLTFLDEIGPYHPENDPFEYQAQFCHMAGWPTTLEILAKGCHLPGNDRRTNRFRTMCKLKLDYPECFFVGRMPEDGDTLSQIIQYVDPIQLTRGEDEGTTPVYPREDVDQVDFLAQLGEGFLYELGECLMESEQPLEEAGTWLESFYDIDVKELLLNTYLGDTRIINI